ncbi:lipid A export permease/ATP-binding protein MsbA [Denitratisoma oestradiolicum]|uniref:Lipid A export ATP-binding/permease protein MsbA n=1 Tax=Denitratisoma oestradiolicum TaxID=311182 RepID=A0A6S6XWH6_9PROT|nr:lipid A export permease/ATP-binding protein MsbA [Denitratisoma oestradiolicum]TWO79299.1 lipid A export permease/ATP-binding protein MsbA [Denitratisoma oestradiolicum]CAB1370374.1 Lipid A export ATP-binding/permease protein MsbA [Denitratisoma oestradiolicum]
MTGSVQQSTLLYRRLLQYVRPYGKVLAFAIGAMILAASTEPLFPALMKPLLDKGFNGSGEQHLYRYPLFIVLIFLARGIFGYVASYCMNWVSNRVVCDIREVMFERLIRLPLGYLHSNPSSRLITRIASDVNSVAAAATSVITTVLRDSLVVVGLMSWLLYLNWRLTLLMGLIVPGIAIAIRGFSKRLRTMTRASQETNATIIQVLQESIDGNKVVKVYNGEPQELARFGKANNDLRRFAVRQNVAAAATTPIVQFFASIAVALVVYIALLQSSGQQTTVGGFVSFITAMLMLLAPIKSLTDVNAPLQRGLAAAESVFTLLDQKPEDDRGTVTLARAEGRLRFEGVRFRYPGAEREALAGIDLDVAPGQTVALVGPSGSGKTTLANLLPRFYHLNEGRILLDGHELEELRLESLRANLALVSQDVVLFDDTVAANIAYGALRGASRADVEAAARAAYAHDFIMAMPQGYDTQIGENGVRLSGGQRQRLAIARALLKNAPLLILDEATSALDSESERQVQAALEHLMEDRTTLVIAHRLSTIEKADKIVVMEHGRVIEQGSHAELLAQDGLYAKLYKMQYALEHTA